jgi:hypothetical protein
MINPNGSHLPALVPCVVTTDGPVLELGLGEFSTPVLHSLCFRTRTLLSVDGDPTAIYNFSQLGDPWHEIRYDPDYRSLDELGLEFWSVVFVDHWPAERRAADVLKFTNTEFLVIHDAEVPSIGPVIMAQGKDKWPHIRLYQNFEPYTLILGRKEIPNLP